MNRLSIFILWYILISNMDISAQAQSAIIINEIMPANIDVYLDPSQNYGSWAELYNDSDQSISLGGLYVTDTPSDLKKNKLCSSYGVLPAHGYALLNFGHHDNFTPEGYRQIDMELDCDGGTIIISDGTTILAQQNYPQAPPRISFGRIKDGGAEWGYTGRPSPGYSNERNGGFALTQLPAPTISRKGCRFDSPFSVDVEITPGSTLRYTIDGTCPTLTNGKTASSTTFHINESCCYRFRLFQEGYLPSNVVTRTFIKDEGNSPFPIISIVTDTLNFYDKDRGLFEIGPYGRAARYTNESYNSNMDWDRPVSFEYITTDNECVVAQECDFAMTGGWSRMVSPHAFKLKAKKQYDFQKYFPYQFFSDKPYLKHKSLLIRSGGDDHTYRVIDVAFQEMIAQSGIQVNYQSFEPVEVYINGKPYAVLNLREPSNKDYAYSNYGIDTDEMDQFEMSPDSSYIQKRGTKDAFNKLLLLSESAGIPSVYQSIRELLDIDEFINYMAIQFYIGNSDWPFNNLKGFRDRNNGKFHFVLFDLDGVFNAVSPFEYFFGMETREFDPLYGYDYSRGVSIAGERLTLPVEFVTLFKNLLQCPSFRKQFIDVLCIAGGSVFEQSHVTHAMEKLNERMTKGNLQDPTGMTNYFKHKMSIKFNYDRMLQLESCEQLSPESKRQKVKLTSDREGATLLINEIEIPYGDFDGFLYGPIQLRCIAPAGYKFSCWKDVKKNEILTKSNNYKLPSADTLEISACFVPLSNNPASIPVRINEISASNSIYVNEYFNKSDWIELYNTTDEAIDIAGMYLSDDPTFPQKYKVAEASTTDTHHYSTNIPAHGYLILWADRLTPANQLHTTFQLGNRDNEMVILTSSDESWQDRFIYKSHANKQSCGRFPDGSSDIYIMDTPTIGQKNHIDSYCVLYNTEHKKGDVNSDNNVDISDIVAIINHIAGVTQYSLSDVNEDKKVDISDIVAIINIIARQ